METNQFATEHEMDAWYEVQQQDGPNLRWHPALNPTTGETITADTREGAESLRHFYDIGYRARTGVPATTKVARRRGQS